jgi:hypothetical protein
MKRVALLSLLLAWTATVCADELTRESLKDMKGVRLLIEVEQNSGLQEATLQEELAQRLTRAGVLLLDHDTWLETPGGQYLYVNVDALCPSTAAICAYAIRVELRQDALLARATALKIHGATTWSSRRIGIAPKAATGDRIRPSIDALIDEFIADYQAVNPTPAQQP